MARRKTRKRPPNWHTMDKGSTPLQKLALQFEAFNRSDGKTPRTTEWHSHTLDLFLRYLQEQGHSCLLKDVSLETVREYILYLQTRPQHPNHNNVRNRKHGLSQSSIDCHVRSLRAFFNWLYQEGYAREHILARLRPPRVPRKVIQPLSETEIAMILSALDTDSLWGARNATIFLCFLDTGLRVSELANLKVEDVHLEEAYLKVFGKGQKERIVPFGGSLQRTLMRYYYHLRPEPARPYVDRFFLSLSGEPLSANAVKLMLKRLGCRSGVTRLHAHLLRHTFALNYLVNGGDVFSLQQILGHTTLEMVRRYVNLASSHVVAQHRRFSPVDRLNLRQLRRSSLLRRGRRKGTDRSSVTRTFPPRRGFL